MNYEKENWDKLVCYFYIEVKVLIVIFEIYLIWGRLIKNGDGKWNEKCYFWKKRIGFI